MLKLFTVSAALAAVLTTTTIAAPIALSVEANNQLVDIPNSLSSSNPSVETDNSHSISALIAVSIVLLLIRNQQQALSRTGFRGRQARHSEFTGGYPTVARRKVSKHLQSKLLNRLDSDVAERLISGAKKANPGKSEQWYLEKVIYDLNRDRR